MKKPSYVNAQNIHEVPFAILRPCWQDDYLYLEKQSYQLLVSRLWKNDVTALAIRLKGHGIFEPVREPLPAENHVSTLNHGSNGNIAGIRDVAISIRVPSSAPSSSYGTLVQGSRAAMQPRMGSTPTLSNARAYSYMPGTYPSHLDMPSRWDTVAVRQNHLPTTESTRATSGNNLALRSCSLAFCIITMFFLVVLWYRLPKD